MCVVAVQKLLLHVPGRLTGAPAVYGRWLGVSRWVFYHLLTVETDTALTVQDRSEHQGGCPHSRSSDQ